jgi:succinate-semialdehyde dehydrogenase / glutarate-semialdehyde dehydrogenase
MKREVLLYIDGLWRPGAERQTLAVFNPATEVQIGTAAKASRVDLDQALGSAAEGFATWRAVPPFERARILRRASDLLRERAKDIAALMTAEQGKPLTHAQGEILSAADTIDWFAEEGKRCFGQVIPGRTADMQVSTRLEPVGPVAAFTPWNFPVSQATRKVATALAAGCSIILKGPEETPASCAELVRAFVDAGLPVGVLTLIFGDPAEISRYLIPHPTIRKVSFTGSVAVGKQLAALAGQHMKRTTMELGGHAPVIVCEDADLESAAAALAKFKFFNAGQVCLSPTRFLVAEPIYDAFLDRFAEETRKIKVGDGFDADTYMGPVANARRIGAMECLTADALDKGGRLILGGRRVGTRGHFYSPTIVADVSTNARAMNEEPFGPLALVAPFATLQDALTEANRLPYGLASFAYTGSLKSEALISERIEAGMLAINRVFQSLPEAPFGGVKDSGYGTEGGTQAIRNFLNEKMVARSF